MSETTWRRIIVAGLGGLVAACGSGGNTEPDTRCFGAAQVPGWTIQVVSSFADAGVVDTFNYKLHATVNATGTAGPVQTSKTNPSGRVWYSGLPTGTLGATDTLISTSLKSDDTLQGVATAFGPGPNHNFGPYLSLDLATCKATLGALLYSQVTETRVVSSFVIQDTLFAGYPFLPNLTVDSLFVANGISVPASKVPSGQPGTSFGATGAYHVGGLVFAFIGDTVVGLDSATVGWTVTPLASLPGAARTAAPAGFTLLPDGVLVPNR
jgi:hypothetical protein